MRRRPRAPVGTLPQAGDVSRICQASCRAGVSQGPALASSLPPGHGLPPVPSCPRIQCDRLWEGFVGVPSGPHPPGNHRCRCAFAGDYGRVVCLPGCRVGEGRDVLVTCSLYHPAPGGRPWWLSDATLWMLFSFNVGSPQRLRNKRSAVGGERRAALGSFWASARLFPSRIAYTETPPLLWEDTQVARGELHLGRKTEASSTGWRQLASRGREPAAVQAGPALRPSLQVTAAPNNIFAAVS